MMGKPINLSTLLPTQHNIWNPTHLQSSFATSNPDLPPPTPKKRVTITTRTQSSKHRRQSERRRVRKGWFRCGRGGLFWCECVPARAPYMGERRSEAKGQWPQAYKLRSQTDHPTLTKRTITDVACAQAAHRAADAL